MRAMLRLCRLADVPKKAVHGLCMYTDFADSIPSIRWRSVRLCLAWRGQFSAGCVSTPDRSADTLLVLAYILRMRQFNRTGLLP